MSKHAATVDTTEPHYRIVKTWRGAEVACVQDFDYPDYEFLSSEVFANEVEAKFAAHQRNAAEMVHTSLWVGLA